MSAHRISLLSLAAAFAAATTLSAQNTPPNLSDPEVAHVAVTANSIDVDAARFALTKTHNAQVRAFANTMITDHNAVNAQASALAGRLHVTPADNAVSQSLHTGANAAHRSLDSLSGAAFDRAYMAREVGYHQAVLDAIDNVLVPTTENADLKKLLVDVRPAIAAHLAHARQLQTSLGTSATR
jgi:putative membrane protein